MSEKRYWLHAVTPLHVGAGRGLGYIDMPIVREKVTNWPYIPGSSLKGVIADYNHASDENRKDNLLLKAAFGTSGSDNESAAGAWVFTDANIFCLPVRSFYGTFAWMTSPFCLRRFDMNINLDELNNNINAFRTNESVLVRNNANIIYLEDLDITSQASNQASDIARNAARVIFADNNAWQDIFIKRFVIVNDDIFTFLCESGTEVNAHIRIDSDTGVAAEGALWYEESLPVESILTGRIWCDKVFVKDITQSELLDTYCKDELMLQIGGKASTGKGQVRCIFEEGN